MARVALLSNPSSTGNKSLLPRVRSFCADHQDIFHYEVEHVDQIGAALKSIARVKPKVLVINGGDGTVQATLTELYHGGHFRGDPPPVAVLPNGKTNLIALDLGAKGDPIVALERVLELAGADLVPHIVSRELISLSDGSPNGRPVLGMFLGGAGLADIILYCRHKIYPLGLPNGISHALAAFATLFAIFFGIRSAFVPPRAGRVKISLIRSGQVQGRYAVLIVTTLERLLLNSQLSGNQPENGALRMLLVEQRPAAALRVLFAALIGRLGQRRMDGIHFERSDEIRIEGDRSSVILDGELFETRADRPIILKPTPPVPFLRLAA